MAELRQSRYVYFSGSEGLFRVKIPNFESSDPEFTIELALYNPTGEIPYNMGMFSHGNLIYMFGGCDGSLYDYSRSMFVIDPNKFHQFPIKDLELLEKPKESCSNFAGMVAPSVIPFPAKNKIYFLSDFFLRCHLGNLRNQVFCFQSFDTTNNFFEKHPPPPNKGKGYCNYGHFLLGSYIYLFLEAQDYSTCAFTFNTISSEWKENDSLLSLFLKNKIPLPTEHRGDVGLSDEFNDNTRILLALCGRMPTAYRVRLLEEGSFEPKSYRVLEESYVPDPAALYVGQTNGWTHLADFGGGRFCVIYGSDYTSILMYVFQIDFGTEHHIQQKGASIGTSSEILSTKIFQFEKDLPLVTSVYSQFCLVSSSAPAYPSTINDYEEKIVYDEKLKMVYDKTKRVSLQHDFGDEHTGSDEREWSEWSS